VLYRRLLVLILFSRWGTTASENRWCASPIGFPVQSEPLQQQSISSADDRVTNKVLKPIGEIVIEHR
jgi:hypothetical protein